MSKKGNRHALVKDTIEIEIKKVDTAPLDEILHKLKQLKKLLIEIEKLSKSLFTFTP